MELAPTLARSAPLPRRTALGRRLAGLRAEILASVTPLIFPAGLDQEPAETGALPDRMPHP